MLKWLIATIWGPPEYVQRAVRRLERQLEGLNDELEHQRGRLNKLQGRVTGGMARQNGDDPAQADPTQLELTEADLNQAIQSGGFRGLPRIR